MWALTRRWHERERMITGRFKGEIATKLALAKRLITEDQIAHLPSAGWDLGAFMDAIGAGQEFLDEVIEIQKTNQRETPMAEIDRPAECPDQNCTCLTSFAGRICVGRLAKKIMHDDMFDTHQICLETDSYCINDADAFYFMECMGMVRKDVRDHNLWCGGRGETYDFGKK